MTMVSSASDTGTPVANHYVDWGAIVAGGLVAFAISSVFIAFGSAVGMSLTSFQTAKSASLTALVIAGALWFLWIQISSFIAGGYIAGRMRRRIGDGTTHEVEMRDGMHGLIVWALGVALAAALASSLAISGLSGATSSSVTDYHVDKMMRSPTASAPQIKVDNSEIGRVLLNNLGHAAIDETDKTYLVGQIMTSTGLTQPDALVRLEQTVATLKLQADTTRRFGILAAFLTAASLLISAVAAWWAATMGGKHRNEGIDHSRLTQWR